MCLDSSQTNTEAAHLLDTIEVQPELVDQCRRTAGSLQHRFHQHGGLCGNKTTTACGTLQAGSIVPSTDTRVSGKLPNYKLEVLYKPTANGSIYVNFAMSREPPGGNAPTFSSSANSRDNPDLEPQKAHAAEIGTKWSLLDERLILTSALYRITVTKPLAQDPTNPTQYDPIGEQRVHGLEINASAREAHVSPRSSGCRA
ncbi:TonB-dependent receptor [Rhodanobacter sp. MP1X3]|uniref:TonB-dependent receptor domain-containing protein n=1 Tax=Rhodanobacter sp. MP1X3 TaxID=2723086 RepID=UPI001615FACF|nr:TonB-dependent receptor [Rhodanobacter sp. MP1X3]MBB6244776.1 outer membrane receptor for monomeric catechols [Rhodanobacter sp. MP1X3]